MPIPCARNWPRWAWQRPSETVAVFTDSHCHLADPAFSGRLAQVLHAAQTQGVQRFIVPATRPQDWADVAHLANHALFSLPNCDSAPNRPSENRSTPHQTNPIHTAFGIHPWFAAQAGEEHFAELETLLRRYPSAWVGETGLDFHPKHADTRAKQTASLLRQLRLAQTLQRRVILHNVKATAALAEAVKQSGFNCGGIAHGFSGSLEEAAVLIKLGFKIGIGALLLNPSAKKARAAAQHLPLSAIVLETDSPFMLPDSGNTPANVRRIAEITADLRGISLAELSEQTEANVDGLLRPF